MNSSGEPGTFNEPTAPLHHGTRNSALRSLVAHAAWQLTKQEHAPP